MNYKVLHGGSDWRHEAWVGNLYPADMPEEWWLSFYTTQFRCVWLERAAWVGVSPGQMRTWLEDSQEGFRFVLEAPEAPDAATNALLRVLEPRIGLVCRADHGDLFWFDARTEMRRLAEAIGARGATDPPLYLISRDNDLAALERAATLLHLLAV